MAQLHSVPNSWCNFFGDLPKPLPPVRDTTTPTAAEVAEAVRPEALRIQDSATERWIPIPDPVRDWLLRIGRPTPLYRASRFEERLRTGARIYFKREDVLPTGSFKLNTAIAQAFYAAEDGRRLVVSETGAGQWGMGVALAASMFGLDSEVFMVRCSLDQKPYRRHYMELMGTQVHPSPSGRTKFGQRLLEEQPEHPGTLGSAISEAIEYALEAESAAYIAGSGLRHVYLHQTLLGLEVQMQLAALEDGFGTAGRGDHLIASSGGGSNLCGLIGPYLRHRAQGDDLTFLAAESTAAPRLTRGTYAYGRSDLAGYTPEIRGYTMGPSFIPPPVHAAGLRNHHSSAAVSLLRHEGVLDAVAVEERTAFEAGRLLAETEGFLVAPETGHAVAAAIDVAKRSSVEDTRPAIVVVASGSGLLDLGSYSEVLRRA